MADIENLLKKLAIAEDALQDFECLDMEFEAGFDTISAAILEVSCRASDALERIHNCGREQPALARGGDSG